MARGAHVSAASGTLSLATRNTMRRTCSQPRARIYSRLPERSFGSALETYTTRSQQSRQQCSRRAGSCATCREEKQSPRFHARWTAPHSCG